LENGNGNPAGIKSAKLAGPARIVAGKRAVLDGRINGLVAGLEIKLRKWAWPVGAEKCTGRAE